MPTRIPILTPLASLGTACDAHWTMAPRRTIILGIVALLILGGSVAWWRAPREPVYKNHKLSEWVEANWTSPTQRQDWVTLEFTNKDDRFYTAAGEAFLAMGTNAIPFYLEWMAYEPGKFKRAQYQLASKAHQVLHLNWFPQDVRSIRAYGGSHLLQGMGETAESAIPQLTRYAASPTPENLSQDAFLCLGYIGPKSIPALLSLMTNREWRVRYSAVDTAARFASNTLVAIQLTNCLQDPDHWVRMGATQALADLHEMFPPPAQKSSSNGPDQRRRRLP